MLNEIQLEFLRTRLDFWDRLSEPEKADLSRATVATRFKKGVSLRSDDSECLGALLVHEGELRVFIQADDGREVTLYRLGPGEMCVLSASCVLNSITFDVLIDATRDSEVFRIQIAAFSDLMKRNVWVENAAYKNAVERFSDVMWAIEQILFMRFDKRLAVFLLDESLKSGSGEIRATHDEIARYVGSAREVVSRMLKSFEADGLVALSRGAVRVLDRERLKKLL
jgi:CRP/FNR family transcriptional regulator, anaerobic regulatory protein